MSGLAFEDAHDYDAPGHYTVPNEGIMLWREVLKHTPVYRAAAICSSGEVGLFSILPLVRRELLLVDHSLRSLHVAMVKYLLLRERGAKDVRRLFTSGIQQDLRDAVTGIQPLLPPKVGEVFASERNPFFYDPYGNRIQELKKEWDKVPETLIKKAVPKLARVKFLHGDLTDLAPQGPFDLVYLSNALEHTSRTRARPAIDQIAQALKPGGYVLAAVGAGDYHGSCSRLRKAGFELLETKKATYMDASISWAQSLYRAPS